MNTQPSSTGLIYDPRFLDHETSPHHPDRPERLMAITEHLHACGLWDQLRHLPVSQADLGPIQSIHEECYIHRVRGACESGRNYLDNPDTLIGPMSYQTALLAVGGVLEAVDQVVKGAASRGVRNAFCAVRPPGHHAERNRSMGFCLFNHVAIAAQHLIDRHGLERVAVVDFDVHHGNGTQHSFETRKDVLVISIHEDPDRQYPGTGRSHEIGLGAGMGYTLNIPMPIHSQDADYQRAFEKSILPALDRFAPQFLLLSTGFDALRGDPLGHMLLSVECFGWMTQELCGIARQHSSDRIVSVLEGGYNLQLLGPCAAAHVQALMQ